jgi:hypothetical protein
LAHNYVLNAEGVTDCGKSACPAVAM